MYKNHSRNLYKIKNSCNFVPGWQKSCHSGIFLLTKITTMDKHTVYTFGLGYWLNLGILHGIVLISDTTEKLRLIFNTLVNLKFGS